MDYTDYTIKSKLSDRALQKYLFKLGIQWGVSGFRETNDRPCSITLQSRKMWWNNYNEPEITLKELKALLKDRND